MKIHFCLIACLFSLSLPAQNINQFEEMTGLKGTYYETEKVFKVTFPRTDVKVSVDGRPLDPFMGLTSWIAFSPLNNQLIVMGDLVLFEDEVNAVMSVLFENHLDVTALHQHFFFDQPKVYFMHIAGIGSMEALSNGIKKAREKISQIRMASSTINSRFNDRPIVKTHSITAKNLEQIFGMQGQAKEGMVKFTIGRKVNMHGAEFGKEMGINTWAAFGGTNENAFVDGDFAVTEEELQAVLRTLRKGNINIVAIHNHMTMENPRLIFLHFWGTGQAEDMAKTIKKGLQEIKS